MCRIPDKFFEKAAECVTTPLACVGTDHYYLWVNKAYEELTGYTLHELRQKTWMDITKSEDIGGDYESAQDVIDGKREGYAAFKTYIHKSGESVPTLVNVWGYNSPVNGSLECFIAQAIRAPEEEIIMAGRAELAAYRAEVDEMKNRLASLERDTGLFKTGLGWLKTFWPIIIFPLLAFIGYLIEILVSHSK